MIAALQISLAALGRSPASTQIQVLECQLLDPQLSINRTGIVFPQVLCQVTFSAADPVGTVACETAPAAGDDFNDNFGIKSNRDLKFGAVRSADYEYIPALRRAPRPVALARSYNAEAVFSDHFNRLRTCRGTVDFQVFFLGCHLTM